MENSTRCHELGKRVSDDLCLACHKAIKVRMDEGKGLHSSKQHQGRRCETCHSEHHGREYQLIWWPDGEKKFDHAETGYRLEGRHAGRDCSDCHKSAFIQDKRLREDKAVNLKTTRLGLSTECVSCHEDEHGDQLPDRCLTCHDTNGWKPAPGFDHARAPYVLTGKHLDVSCEKCHPWEKAPKPLFTEEIQKQDHPGLQAIYRLPGRFPGCTPCHDDPHRGRHRKPCVECHQTSGWAQLVGNQPYDHDQTGYPLRGRHMKVDCVKCHESGKMTDPLPHQHCTDCHADEHRGQFASRPDGIACESCHTVVGFLPSTFTVKRHDQTDYPLEGSHLAVPCNLCHKQVEAEDGVRYAQFTFTKRNCQACHRDVHEGQLDRWIREGGCEICHNVATWHTTSFNHDRTDFHLVGKHRQVSCLKCHREADDGSGKEKIWFKPQSKACAACHDDIHRGQLVRDEAGNRETRCDRCHSPYGWQSPNLLFSHDRDSRFKLLGAHEKVSCPECHRTRTAEDGVSYVVYKPLDTACASCHSPNAIQEWERRKG